MGREDLMERALDAMIANLDWATEHPDKALDIRESRSAHIKPFLPPEQRRAQREAEAGQTQGSPKKPARPKPEEGEDDAKPV